MKISKPQKAGPPPEPRFTPGALLDGWRSAFEVSELTYAKKIRSALDYARLSSTRGITTDEYFNQYHFYNLKKTEQESFITVLEAQKITWKMSQEIRDVFWNKDRFLTTFADFIHRDWVRITEGQMERFRGICQRNTRLIIKPRAATEGRGIGIVGKAKMADPDALFEELLKEDCIIEEILQSDERLAAFNPSSLNTVRVVTLYNGEYFEVYGAVVRFGREGSAVDNVSAGGLYAALDPLTGEIITDGMDMTGKHWLRHPDSDKEFRGFSIPRWDKVLDTVKAAVKVQPDIRIAGWDIALLHDGNIALVEGNHMPDIDLLQQPLLKGIRHEFEEKVRVLFGERFLDSRS